MTHAVSKEKVRSTENDRMLEIIKILSGIYPAARIQLDFTNPFELLVATILSAQCTDARVNIVTKDLFKKYKTPQDYLLVPAGELEKYIYSTGFYKAKARHIKMAAETVLDKFGGRVPGTMDELLSLPGVGRKTANVVLGHCFDIPGIVVDTHVIRLSNRLGFVQTENPDKIEFALMELVPKNDWVAFTHYIISHGRAVCTARKPRCGECAISGLCPSAFKV